MKRVITVLSAFLVAVVGLTQFGYGSSVASAMDRKAPRKAPREAEAPPESLGSLEDLDPETRERFSVEIGIVEERIKSAEEASVLSAESPESDIAPAELFRVLEWSIVDLGDGEVLLIQDTGDGVRVFIPGRGEGTAEDTEGTEVFGTEGRTEITRLDEGTIAGPSSAAAGGVSCTTNDNIVCCAWSNPPRMVCLCRGGDGQWTVCFQQPLP